MAPGKNVVIGVVIALLILTMQLFRWQIVGAGNGAAYKLDRLTGGVTFILGPTLKAAKFEKVPKWKPVVIDE